MGVIFNFADTFALLPAGTRLKVSDGTSEPGGGQDSQAWRIWRSHNFEGRIDAKHSGSPRSITFALPEQNGAQVSYTVAETDRHLFAEVDPPVEGELGAAQRGKRRRAAERALVARMSPRELVAEFERRMAGALDALFVARGLPPLSGPEKAAHFPTLADGAA
jgi:hypothetical protein